MLRKLILFITSLSLISCSAMKTSIEKRDLRVNTTMSNSIFLSPVSLSKKTIFIQVRSNVSDFYLESSIKNQLIAKGYKIVSVPSQAEFILQANLRSITRSVAKPDSTLDTIGGAVIGGAIGSAFGAGTGQIATTAAGAAVGGAAGNALSTAVEDVTYTAIVDVLVSQKITGTNKFKSHTTRITSKANKADLTKQEAHQAIVYDIVNALSGIF